jgi:ubiquinone/menaquinone biosynthesis C-methylase UbiE
MSIRIDEQERENHGKYSGAFYKIDTITRCPPSEPQNYAERLLQVRLSLVAQYIKDATVLDLCCGTGEHLMSFSKDIKQGKGVDYSAPFIEKANRTATAGGYRNIEFCHANARDLPFEDGYFDLAYSFSSLCHIPRIEGVIREIARVLRQRGKCVLDMANLYSLNTVVCHNYPEYARGFHISVRQMQTILSDAHLVALDHTAFQILPMWGDRPGWMSPLVKPGVIKFLARKFRGKMLDEWISNLPLLKLLAFRHVFVCEKRA